MGLLWEVLGKGNVKIKGFQPGVCVVGRRALPCTPVCTWLLPLTVFGAASLLYEQPCRPAVHLGAQQRALTLGLAHHRALGVLPAQAERGRDPEVG